MMDAAKRADGTFETMVDGYPYHVVAIFIPGLPLGTCPATVTRRFV